MYDNQLAVTHCTPENYFDAGAPQLFSVTRDLSMVNLVHSRLLESASK
jgi:hypothetical protein